MRGRSTQLTKLYEKSMDLGPVTGPGDLGSRSKVAVR